MSKVISIAEKLNADRYAGQRRRDGHDLKAANSKHSSRHFKAAVIVITTSLAGFWMTALGLYNDAIEAGVDDFQGMVTATIGATVAGVAIGGASAFLLDLSSETPKRLWKPLATLIVALVPFVVFISTISGIRGYAGPPALVSSMRESAAEWAAYVESQTKDSGKAKSTLATLQPLSASICQLAGLEQKSGIVTGSAAPGAVSSAYASSCIQVKAIVDTLKETTSTADSHREQLNALLGELHAIPDDSASHVFARKAAFRAKAGNIRKILDASSTEKVGDRVKAQLGILQASVVSINVKSGEFGDRQTAAIDGLKSSLQQIAVIVATLIDEQAESHPQPGELPDTGTAVLRHWPQHIAAIMLAIAVDLIVIWYAGMLALSRAIPRAREEDLATTPAWIDIAHTTPWPHGPSSTPTTAQSPIANGARHV